MAPSNPQRYYYNEQLRSACTDDYWRARSLLQHALRVFESMEEDGVVVSEEEDEVILKHRTNTEEMLADAEEEWQERWAAQGEEPPQEQSIRDTYTIDEAELEGASAQETAALRLRRGIFRRGGSPEIAGVEAPCSEAPDAESTSQDGQTTTSTPKDDRTAPLSPPHSPPPAHQPTVEDGGDDEMEK
ncbi:hypothetical protein LTR36_009653 [Oleoguttula mirabilis]|uniref:Uncharacterized protein n=1 Tax=Oleoguttula mirabilis TaxID=1507867 RepID=A0AAV9J5N8_9PEZI|nr:hypothetical protein LTR36_009653 [Oleoguttula mirabilis]